MRRRRCPAVVAQIDGQDSEWRAATPWRRSSTAASWGSSRTTWRSPRVASCSSWIPRTATSTRSRCRCPDFVSAEIYVLLVLTTRVNIGMKVTIRQGRRSHDVQKEGDNRSSPVPLVWLSPLNEQ
nr:uncharacterized protein LOC109755437 [Aegilops tauschii subsp. strangulata]